MMADTRRPRPAYSLGTEFFWKGGAAGELRFHRCNDCEGYLHPPTPICRYCRSQDIEIAVVSGRGTVAAFSINIQQWSAMPVPYVVAVVQIEEDPRVHLLTNVLTDDPSVVSVGMPVEVTFEQVDDTWVPLFESTGGPLQETFDTDESEDVAQYVRPMASPKKFEDAVAITGIGMSQLGRRLMRPPLEYTIEACTKAIEDAGLEWSDIDGLSSYPGQGDTGMTEGGIGVLEDILRVRPTWFNSGSELPGQIGSISHAMVAVASGLCRHVLCFRTVWQASETEIMRNAAAAGAGGGGGPASGPQWGAPYGATKAINTLSAFANRYMHRYGATRETLGWIAVNARRNAELNPRAIYRTPMTIDDYLDARMISDPFGLYDCDTPVDGAVAIIISARETAKDLRQPAVFVEAVGQQMIERPAWDQGTMSYLPHAWSNAAHMWSRTDLRPSDIDVAELYDGFTFNCLSWIEALGFCGRGEAKDFLHGGHNIARDGVLPLNTHGGQLSEGRLHGYGFVHEAVSQLRGQAGDRQVHDARAAVAAAGGYAPGGVMLLTNDR